MKQNKNHNFFSFTIRIDLACYTRSKAYVDFFFIRIRLRQLAVIFRCTCFLDHFDGFFLPFFCCCWFETFIKSFVMQNRHNISTLSHIHRKTDCRNRIKRETSKKQPFNRIENQLKCWKLEMVCSAKKQRKISHYLTNRRRQHRIGKI